MFDRLRWTSLTLSVASLVVAVGGCSSPGAATTGASSQAAKPTAAASQAAQPTAGASQAAKAASAPAQASTSVDKLLTIADVEKVSGLTGIKLVPYDPNKGAGGDLNFATSGGDLVLILNQMSSSLYDKSKQQKGMVKEQVSGIGDDAFSGPADDNSWAIKGADGHALQIALGFRKGSSAATLGTFLKAGGTEPYLSQDQLRELAKLIVSRM